MDDCEVGKTMKVKNGLDIANKALCYKYIETDFYRNEINKIFIIFMIIDVMRYYLK